MLSKSEIAAYALHSMMRNPNISKELRLRAEIRLNQEGAGTEEGYWCKRDERAKQLIQECHGCQRDGVQFLECDE